MCIINHTYGFVFVHIPKTAGTSLAHALSRASSYRDVEVGATAIGEAIQTPFRERYGIHKHSTAEELRAFIGHTTWTRMFTFAFLRDPLQRAISTFRFLKHGYRGWAGSEVMDKLATFAEFVRDPLFQGSGPDDVLLPQIAWVGQPPIVDFLGRVNAIEQDLAAILERLGLPAELRAKVSQLGRLNTTQSWQTHESPDEATVAAIRARYRADYELIAATSLRR